MSEPCDVCGVPNATYSNSAGKNFCRPCARGGAMTAAEPKEEGPPVDSKTAFVEALFADELRVGREGRIYRMMLADAKGLPLAPYMHCTEIVHEDENVTIARVHQTKDLECDCMDCSINGEPTH